MIFALNVVWINNLLHALSYSVIINHVNKKNKSNNRVMKNIFEFFRKDNIGNPPWDYYFLQNLDEKEYPKYLAKLFYLNTGEKLPLSHRVIDKKKLKTFNQKIQWIKLYGVTDLMRDCTDKVKVRDYVRKIIGAEYLKPVLQVIPSCHSENLENQNVNSVDFQVVQNLKEEKSKKSQQALCHNELVSGSDINNNQKMLKHACIDDNIQSKKINYTAVQHDRPLIDFVPKSNDVSTYFDLINWDKLPSAFVIKTNHGCQWQYIIKDKEEFLKTPKLAEIVKHQIIGWLEQDYSFWGGFELNYHGIEPKILIEPLMRDNINKICEEIQIYCCSGIPQLIIKLYNEQEITIYDENLKISKNTLGFNEKRIDIEADDLINQTFVLSKQLSKNFNFVRVDWLIFRNKIYFEELTFTPFSGFHKLINNKIKFNF